MNDSISGIHQHSAECLEHIKTAFTENDLADAQSVYQGLKNKTLAKEDALAFIIGCVAGQQFAITAEHQLIEAQLSLAETNGTLADLLAALPVPDIEPRAIAIEGFMTGMGSRKGTMAKKPLEEEPGVGDASGPRK